MSGTLINPNAIPGVDLDPAQISSSADGYRTTAGSVRSQADAVLADWSGMAAPYIAPEAPQLLDSMAPVGVDSGAFADKLTRVADLLDDLASAVQAPVRRLKELQQEAERFVADVRGGVTVQPDDPDHPVSDWGTDVGAIRNVFEDTQPETIPWDQHTPSLEENNRLQEAVATETALLLAASTECVNGINALREDACIAPEAAAPTAEEIVASGVMPWGETGQGDRSCNESVNDGAEEFFTGLGSGLAALGGYDTTGGGGFSWDNFSWDTAGSAWGGVVSGLGAIVVTAATGGAFLWTPRENMPSFLHGVQDWQQETMGAMLEGIVGSPEMWEDDPVAAGTYAVLSIGSFFIPGVGQVGGGVKVAGVLGRAGLAVERMGGLAADGSRLANGTVRAGSLLTDLGDLMRRIHGGETVPGAQSTRALDEMNERIEQTLADVRFDDLAGRVTDDTVPVSARAGETSASSRVDGGTTEVTSGGGTTLTETVTGGGRTDGASTGDGGPGRGDGASSDGAPDGTGDHVDPTRSDAPSGPGWERGPEHRGDPIDPEYGRPRADHGRLDDRFAPPETLPEEIRHLVGDPDAPYGRDLGGDEHALTRAEWESRFMGPDDRPIYPGNAGAVPGSRVEFTDMAAFRREYGDVLDRMGGDGGDYLAFPDTPFEQRGLPGSNLNAPYSTFRLGDELPPGVRIEVSEIAPAFGQPGGGLQVRFLEGERPIAVADLVDPNTGPLTRSEPAPVASVVETVPAPRDFPRPEVASEVVGQAAPGARTPFAARTDLAPDTVYRVEGRGDFYTDSTGRVTYVEAQYGGRGSLNADLQKPQPNTTYVVHPDTAAGETSRAHVFETDERGRTTRAHTDDLAVAHADRSESVQTRVGDEGGAGYDGGHLLGTQFGGGGEYANMVAMLRELNRGSGDTFFNLESRWRSLVDADPPVRVEVDIRPVYEGTSARPSRILVLWTEDGAPKTKDFTNE